MKRVLTIAMTVVTFAGVANAATPPGTAAVWIQAPDGGNTINLTISETGIIQLWMEYTEPMDGEERRMVEMDIRLEHLIQYGHDFEVVDLGCLDPWLSDGPFSGWLCGLLDVDPPDPFPPDITGVGNLSYYMLRAWADPPWCGTTGLAPFDGAFLLDSIIIHGVSDTGSSPNRVVFDPGIPPYWAEAFFYDGSWELHGYYDFALGTGADEDNPLYVHVVGEPPPPLGACCDWGTFDCQDDVPEDECDGPDEQWTEGTLCADLDPPCAACQANELAKLLASDGAPGDQFTYWSLAIDGDTAVIGAQYDDDLGADSGSAYVFRFDGYDWVQEAKLLASDGAAGDEFGRSVGIHGDTIVAGAYGDDDLGNGYGSAYVFRFDGYNWVQEAKLLAGDAPPGDSFSPPGFGYNVAIDGGTIAAAAQGKDEQGIDCGSVYVFVRNGTDWSQQAKLLPSDAATWEYFGQSVAIHGDDIVVGIHGGGSTPIHAGSAYVFVRSGTTWTQQVKLVAPDAAAEDHFGKFVDIDGDTVVSGAYADDGGLGSAYVFVRSGSSWSHQAKLLAGDGAAGDVFGWSVGIEADTIVAGAYGDDDLGTDSGSACVFRFDGANWIEEAKLLAFDGAAGDRFGYSVAISDGTALIGAPFDDDNGTDSGSAYVFRGLSDCNTNGTLDICDIAEGTSADCQPNGIPDECELAGGTSEDCNTNAIPDECDIAEGTSQDINTNGVPDECETADLSCTESDQVIVPGGTVSFDIFVAGVTGLNAYQIDVEVVGTSGTGELLLNECAVDEARADFVFFGIGTYVDTNCSPDDLRITVVAAGGATVDVPDDAPAYLGTYVFDVSTDGTNGTTFELHIKPEPDSLLVDEQSTRHLLAPGDPCQTVVCEAPTVLAEGGRYLQVTPNQPGSLGEQAIRLTSPSCPAWSKYVDSDGCLVDTPEFLTAVEWDTVHITGDEIVPSFDYEVAAACGDVDTLSASVPATTWLCGDVNNDTVINVIDIQKVVQCAEETFYPPTTVFNADLDVECPTLPDDVCDLDDLMVAQDAFRALPCPGSAPCGGRSTEPEDAPTEGDAVVTLLAADPTLGPGNVFVVDAFIDSAADLRGYQLELSFGGGSSGSLECEDLMVDTGRPDYVFCDAEVADWPWANLPLCRLSSSLTESGMDVDLDAKYLGTFMLRSSPDADGSFSAELAATGSASFLRNSVRGPIGFEGGSLELTVVTIPGDIDLDADVDLNDFASFALCLGGSGVTVPPVDCSESEFGSSDTDADGDVDLNDFAIFTLNFGD